MAATEECELIFEVTLPNGVLSWLAYGAQARVDGRSWQRLRRGRTVVRTAAGSHEVEVRQRSGRYIVERTHLRAETARARSVTIEVNVSTGMVQMVERPA